jgi:hypothetical protein
MSNNTTTSWSGMNVKHASSRIKLHVLRGRLEGRRCLMARRVSSSVNERFWGGHARLVTSAVRARRQPASWSWSLRPTKSTRNRSEAVGDDNDLAEVRFSDEANVVILRRRNPILQPLPRCSATAASGPRGCSGSCARARRLRTRGKILTHANARLRADPTPVR